MNLVRHDPVELYDILTGLRFSTRFQRHPCLWPMNVAEHSAFVAMLADCLVADAVDWLLYHDDTEFAASLLTQLPDIVRAALWHDALEAYTTDIPRDVKRKLSQSTPGSVALDALEHDAQQLMQPKVGSMVPLGHLQGYPRVFVKLADNLELILYVLHERRAGNQGIVLPAHWTWRSLESSLMAELATLEQDRLGTVMKKGLLAWYEGILDAWRPVLQTQAPPPDYLEGWRR